MEDAEKLNKFNLFVGRIYKTALERRRIGDLKSSGSDCGAACFNAIDAYTGFHPLLRNPIMSDISNRSAYRVTVARRPEHDRIPRHNISWLAQPGTYRVARQPRTAGNLSNGFVLAEMHPPDLANHVHGDHSCSPCLKKQQGRWNTRVNFASA
jgi:hypothetical protein